MREMTHVFVSFSKVHKLFFYIEKPPFFFFFLRENLFQHVPTLRVLRPGKPTRRKIEIITIYSSTP